MTPNWSLSSGWSIIIASWIEVYSEYFGGFETVSDIWKYALETMDFTTIYAHASAYSYGMYYSFLIATLVVLDGKKVIQ